jgi:4-amino-4-deoxy-L-arabinose transferase-like glycosyltransferase
VRLLGRHRLVLLCLGFGLALFVWQLGSNGLVDETPPLFAASARAMADTGDWLTPRVNGLPRYDKPPLVYWLMALGYLLPGQAQWDPLGTWAACLPSALASIAVMLTLALTLERWPQPAGPGTSGRGVALTAALAFALSPLNLLWGRMAVSDALFSGLLSFSLLLFWRAQARRLATATPGVWRGWWHGWLLLGLAVLAKGPVALVLGPLTLLVFALLQGELGLQLRGLRAGVGPALSLAVAAPWYAAALVVEGKPFWDSFFGYHNLQRFSSVVNNHLQPWWFFGPILVAASLPVTPLLLLGLARALRQPPAAPATSLARFAACWLLVVLAFFTLAATKLPSYWIPATPAAAVLIATTAAQRPGRLAWGLTLALAALLAGALLSSPLWFAAVNDPELPGLAQRIMGSTLLIQAGLWFVLAAVLPLLVAAGNRLLAVQLPLVGFALLALLPLWSLGDSLRGAPVRQMAAAVVRHRRPQESLAMVGVLKPSLHYYSRQVVLYEGNEPRNLANLAERLRLEQRRGQRPSSSTSQPTLLVVIDQRTAGLPHWLGLHPQLLQRSGIYQLWRLQRHTLDHRAGQLGRSGISPDWQQPRAERY